MCDTVRPIEVLARRVFSSVSFSAVLSQSQQLLCVSAFCLQFEIRQLRAHLAQQDLDLASEREAAMQIQHVWGKQGRSFQVVEGLTPGESDDESGQRSSRKPHASAGTVPKSRGARRLQGRLTGLVNHLTSERD